jgi:threonine aldolase
MRIIDLRSDTVTQPTQEMRDAMAAAQVGDDVYGEDPTVNRLQEKAAEMMRMEAGLFVPSGTMGNLIAVLAGTQRGDEVIMGDRGHTFLFEAGGVSALGGVFAHILKNQADGSIDLDEVIGAIRPDDIHQPPTKMLILENTHNRCGGVVLGLEYMNQAAKIAKNHGLHLHLDGARIFNAAAALGVDVRQLTSSAESVTFCLSKGLCAPVGSVLCGTAPFIHKARRIRKMLGGGMRQAGVLAAAGLISLEKMTTRLSDDHLRAKRLAEGLSSIPGISFDLGLPQTNMVFPSLKGGLPITVKQLAKQLAERGIRVGVVGEHTLRLVTHYWITDDDIDTTLAAMKLLLHG